MSLEERYEDIKAENPGTLLLYRDHEYYRLLHDDAKLAANVLGLKVTTVESAEGVKTARLGFPAFKLDEYLHLLIGAGYRVSICEAVSGDEE